MPRKKIDVREKIIEALKSETELTWSGLLKKTGVSKGALSIHLNRLIKSGIIVQEILETRPPKTIYKLAEPPILNTIEEIISFGMETDEIREGIKKFLTPKMGSLFLRIAEKIFEFINDLYNSLIYVSGDKKIVKSEREVYDMFLEITGLPKDTLKEIEKKVRKKEGYVEVRVEALYKIFGCYFIEVIATIYAIEKYLASRLSLKEKDKIIKKFFLVLPCIQEAGLQKEFDEFFKWWRKEVTMNLPSWYLIIFLVSYCRLSYPLLQRKRQSKKN